MRRWLLAAALAATAASAFEVQGDGIPQPLTGTPGDAARGRAIVASRQLGLCLLCHSGPFPEERLQGNLAPPLDGAGRPRERAKMTPCSICVKVPTHAQEPFPRSRPALREGAGPA